MLWLKTTRPTSQVVATRDLTQFAFGDAQGIVFAPSGDLTDDPTQMSLYVADRGAGFWGQGQGAGSPQGGQMDAQSRLLSALRAGLSLVFGGSNVDEGKETVEATDYTQSTGQTAELSFAEVPSVVAALVESSLVQTIQASEWSPPSPDPSGVVYLPASDTLLVSDGEVNEMPIYDGINVFESTLTGNLILGGSFTTPSFGNNEPTGISVNAANGHLFISQDTPPKPVYELDHGPDMEYDTADDAVTSLPIW